MGVSAAQRLASVYEALESDTAVLLGSDTHALAGAVELIGKGVRIAAIVEQADAVSGDAGLLAQLLEHGATLLTGHVVREASGNALGLQRISVAAIDATEHPLEGAATAIDCDTLLLGIAAIPAIELLEAAGCSVTFDSARGGHVAVCDARQRTSLPWLLVAGDCASVWAAKSLDEELARREGRIAAHTALAALGVDSGPAEPAVEPAEPVVDLAAQRSAWVRSTTLNAPNQPPVCLCEEVTAGEILGHLPPRYLGWSPEPAAEATPLRKSTPHPDVTKRLTRACMGACQGRRCREQVASLLSLDSGQSLADIALASFRPPVRPLSLRQLAQFEETGEMRAHWDAWFDMPSQWTPFWLCGAQPTLARRPVQSAPTQHED
jgi:hypothetical protein